MVSTDDAAISPYLCHRSKINLPFVFAISKIDDIDALDE